MSSENRAFTKVNRTKLPKTQALGRRRFLFRFAVNRQFGMPFDERGSILGQALPGSGHFEQLIPLLACHASPARGTLRRDGGTLRLSSWRAAVNPRREGALTVGTAKLTHWTGAHQAQGGLSRNARCSHPRLPGMPLRL